MNKLYVIITLIISTQLFGAAVSGDSAQERFDNALKTQDSAFVIRSFADLPAAERGIKSNNYRLFAHFIRNNKPTDEALVQQIINLYRSSHHPIRLWVEHNDARALDEQLPKNVEDDIDIVIPAELSDTSDDNPFTAVRRDAFSSTAQPIENPANNVEDDIDTVIPAELSDISDDNPFTAVRRGAFSWTAQPIENPANPVHPTTAQLSLQDKVIHNFAEKILAGDLSAENVVKQINSSGIHPDTKISYLNSLAKIVFFAELKNRNLNRPPRTRRGAKTDFYPQHLLPYLHLSVQDYIDHEMAPTLVPYENSLNLDSMLLSSLEGIENIRDIQSTEIINASYNKLTELPTFIGNLTSLLILNVSGNELTTLPAFITNLTSENLFHLDVSRNPINAEEKQNIIKRIRQATDRKPRIIW